MAFVDEKDSERRRRSNDAVEAGSAGQQKGKGRPASDVGRALRSAYDRTVNEDIPPEMLDLLGKLN